nr:MAG TPA: hypothetical protein [Bacteriophage sp.]
MIVTGLRIILQRVWLPQHQADYINRKSRLPDWPRNFLKEN